MAGILQVAAQGRARFTGTVEREPLWPSSARSLGSQARARTDVSRLWHSLQRHSLFVRPPSDTDPLLSRWVVLCWFSPLLNHLPNTTIYKPQISGERRFSVTLRHMLPSFSGSSRLSVGGDCPICDLEPGSLCPSQAGMAGFRCPPEPF